MVNLPSLGIIASLLLQDTPPILMEGPIVERREINFLTRIQIGIVIAIILMIISALVKIETVFLASTSRYHGWCRFADVFL